MSEPTLTPSESTADEFVLSGGDTRARLLALALGARVVRRPIVRLFLTALQSRHWRSLYDAGFHAVRRNGQVGFQRDPRPLPLTLAVREGRAGRQPEENIPREPDAQN